MLRLTAGWRWACLTGLLVATAGCDWIPVRRRVDPKLYPVSAPTRSDVGAPEIAHPDRASLPPKLPPLPKLRPYSAAELAHATAPTPLLDEALARAEMVENATAEAIEDEPTPPPTPRPILQLADPKPPLPAPIEQSETMTPVPAEPTPPPFEPVPGPPVEPPVREPFVLVPAPSEAAAPRAKVGPAPAEDDTTLWRTVMELMAEKSAAAASKSAVPEKLRLRIADSRICTRVDGYRSFLAADPTACRAGQNLLVYCELEGVNYEPVGSGYRSELELRVELVYAESGRVVWSDDRPVTDETVAPRQDYFLTYKDWTLPEPLEPGRYLLNMRIEDERSGDAARRGLMLTILE